MALPYFKRCLQFGTQEAQGGDVAAGDHIFVRRLGYTHHGVEVADGLVIHFTGTPGSKRGAAIRQEPIEVFRSGGVVQVRRYEQRLEPDVAVERAESKLGQSGYNLYANNCEHFARWCVTGNHRSSQVNGVSATGGVVATTTAAAAGGVGVITAVGEVAGLSGAGIMSGLGAAGGVVGAGAGGGLVVLGAGPAVLSAAVMNVALRDDVSLPSEERAARKAGRAASVAGAAGGSVAGVAAVSAAGSIAGLSAAGITSGLAAIGATVGGGMATGSAIVIAAPAVAAAGIGYGAYRILRRVWRSDASAFPPSRSEAVSDGDGRGTLAVDLEIVQQSTEMSPRQQGVIDLLATGQTTFGDDELAVRLGTSHHYINQICRKPAAVGVSRLPARTRSAPAEPVVWAAYSRSRPAVRDLHRRPRRHQCRRQRPGRHGGCLARARSFR